MFSPLALYPDYQSFSDTADLWPLEGKIQVLSYDHFLVFRQYVTLDLHVLDVISCPPDRLGFIQLSWFAPLV